MRNWYYFNWLCGDHILEQHIHNIDVANWFIGEYPESAQGMGGRQVRNGNDHGEIFDHHFVEFTYPSGAVISSQCRQIPGTMQRVDEVFHGKTLLAQTISKLLDALGDMLYILCGTILTHGMQHKIEEVFDAIQQSNMSKLDVNGKPIYREDGKVLKGPNYFKPDITKFFK